MKIIFGQGCFNCFEIIQIIVEEIEDGDMILCPNCLEINKIVVDKGLCYLINANNYRGK